MEVLLAGLTSGSELDPDERVCAASLGRALSLYLRGTPVLGEFAVGTMSEKAFCLGAECGLEMPAYRMTRTCRRSTALPLTLMPLSET
jgi:hypothetical protein